MHWHKNGWLMERDDRNVEGTTLLQAVHAIPPTYPPKNRALRIPVEEIYDAGERLDV